jgi:hypothetical protein
MFRIISTKKIMGVSFGLDPTKGHVTGYFCEFNKNPLCIISNGNDPCGIMDVNNKLIWSYLEEAKTDIYDKRYCYVTSLKLYCSSDGLLMPTPNPNVSLSREIGEVLDMKNGILSFKLDCRSSQKEDQEKIIVSNTIIKSYPNGVTCFKCGDFNKYVTESNQEDGRFKCRSCKVWARETVC